MAKKRSPPRKAERAPREVAWSISRITGTPAKYLGQVYATTEADAIKRAIEEFNIRDPEQQKRLVARRAG